jgi:hypothetical protein
MKRRQFLQTTAATYIAAVTNPISLARAASQPAFELEELSIADLQQGMQSGL